MAVDYDKGTNAHVRYELAGPGSELFHIDPDSGLVTVGNLDPDLLDREVQEMYQLQVSG